MSSPVQPRVMNRVLALSVAAIVMLIPANLLPVMLVQQVGETPVEPTILGGVQLLAEQGFWGLAMIVFTASILIPFLKIAGLAVLWGAARGGPGRHAQQLTRLHATLDFIGRWSMLDVFLVAFLSGAVDFGIFARVEPRQGILAFALVVVLTMLATRAFDPLLLWRARHEVHPRTSIPS